MPFLGVVGRLDVKNENFLGRITGDSQNYQLET
jgi:hypothetical protein